MLGKTARILRSLLAAASLLAFAYVAYAAMASRSATVIETVSPGFDGIVSGTSGDATPARHTRLLMVHGIGSHCMGYSDALVSGIGKHLGLRTMQSLDTHLAGLRQSIEREVDAFIVEHGARRGADRAGGENPRSARLRVLAAIRDDAADGERRARAATYLLLLKYGFTDSGCRQVAFPESQPLTDFNRIDNSRINTCEAIQDHLRLPEDRANPSDLVSVECHRLTLDFYAHDVVAGYLAGDAFPPRVENRPPCDGTAAPTECVDVDSSDLAFLITSTYRLPGAPGKAPRYFTVYELTWDPATRWAKQTYTTQDDAFERDLVNGRLKRDVVNDSLSDAVMYLGTYKPLIQYPLLAAFCKILTDRIPAGSPAAGARSPEFRCSRDRGEIPSAEQFGADNELIVITHSLGTRILFDTLGLIGQGEFMQEVHEGLRKNFVYLHRTSVEGIERNTRELQATFFGALRKVFVLANQVPLLELANLTRPYRHPMLGDRDIGRGFDRFLKKRVESTGAGTREPLQLVAFTDTNDLLSYNLKCWYQRHVLRWSKEFLDQEKQLRASIASFRTQLFAALNHCEGAQPAPEPGLVAWTRRLIGLPPASASAPPPGTPAILDEVWKLVARYIRLSDVTVELQGRKLPGLFADPHGAHSNYFRDPVIHELISCGGDAGTNTVTRCRPAGA